VTEHLREQQYGKSTIRERTMLEGGRKKRTNIPTCNLTIIIMPNHIKLAGPKP